MEEEATQKATQPCDDVRRNENKPMLSEEDEGDVICVLHPASIPACEAVDLIVKTTPQHILTQVLKIPENLENRSNKPEDQDSKQEDRNNNKPEDRDNKPEDQDNNPEDRDNNPEDQNNILEDQGNIFEDQDNISEDQDNMSEDQDNISEDQHVVPEDQDNMQEDRDPQADLKDANSEHQRPTSPHLVGLGKKSADMQYSSNDIALRFSSRLRNPCMGFVFGRDESSCDLTLSKKYDRERRISKSHFRMFFNHLGVLMLEDISTNGTVVGGERLQAKTDNTKRMIAGGDVIEIILSSQANRCMRFIVAFPARYNPKNRFAHNLAKYIAWLDQEARRAEVLAQAAVDGRPQMNPAVVCQTAPLQLFMN